jgi:adenylate cyclase
VARRIVAALQVTLTPAEAAMVGLSPTGNLEAHDLLLKARALFTTRTITPPVIREVQAMLERAIEIDPAYGESYAFLALTHVAAYNNSWTESPDGTLDTADELATRAVALAPTSGLAHTILSTVAGFKKDFERSAAAGSRALELLPNDPQAWLSRGAIALYGGDPAGSVPSFERSRRLDPAGTDQAVHFLGLAHLLLRHYETAATYFRERIRLSPQTDFSRMMLASALGHLGRIEEARAAWADLKRINPDYSFALHRSRMPFRTPAEGDLIEEGLRKAGVLDGPGAG